MAPDLERGTTFKRVKCALFESFVGAIALGWLLAEAISHFSAFLAAPFAGWITTSEYGHIVSGRNFRTDFLLRDALPELVRSVFLLAVWYVLLRWLYFKPVKKLEAASVANPAATEE